MHIESIIAQCSVQRWNENKKLVYFRLWKSIRKNFSIYNKIQNKTTDNTTMNKHLKIRIFPPFSLQMEKQKKLEVWIEMKMMKKKIPTLLQFYFSSYCLSLYTKYLNGFYSTSIDRRDNLWWSLTRINFGNKI